MTTSPELVGDTGPTEQVTPPAQDERSPPAPPGGKDTSTDYLAKMKYDVSLRARGEVIETFATPAIALPAQVSVDTNEGEYTLQNTGNSVVAPAPP